MSVRSTTVHRVWAPIVMMTLFTGLVGYWSSATSPRVVSGQEACSAFFTAECSGPSSPVVLDLSECPTCGQGGVRYTILVETCFEAPSVTAYCMTGGPPITLYTSDYIHWVGTTDCGAEGCGQWLIEAGQGISLVPVVSAEAHAQCCCTAPTPPPAVADACRGFAMGASCQSTGGLLVVMPSLCQLDCDENQRRLRFNAYACDDDTTMVRVTCVTTGETFVLSPDPNGTKPEFSWVGWSECANETPCTEWRFEAFRGSTRVGLIDASVEPECCCSPLSTATPTCNTCTPVPPPATAVPPTCEQPGTLDWRRWYPLDYGQSPGFRALNWWSDPQYCWFRGVSLYDQPGVPGGFPLTRTVGGETECVDYYWLWTCGDPNCSWRRPQLLSIGRDGGDLLLWGNTEPRGNKDGTRDMFQVMLDTSAMGCVPCQANAIRNFFASHPESKPADFLLPMRYRLPGQTGTGASEPTNGGCMVMFDPWVLGDLGEGDTVTLDPCKIVGDFTITKPNGTQAVVPDQTGHEFVMTTNLGYLNDPGESCNIIQAVNWSMTDNPAACAAVDQQCRDLAPGVSDPRCEDTDGVPGFDRAKRFQLPSGVQFPCGIGNCTFCARYFEVYRMRRKDTPNSGGFISYSFNGEPCGWDTCDVYTEEPKNSTTSVQCPNGCDPGPGTPAPTPVPTRSGPECVHSPEGEARAFCCSADKITAPFEVCPENPVIEVTPEPEPLSPEAIAMCTGPTATPLPTQPACCAIRSSNTKGEQPCVSSNCVAVRVPTGVLGDCTSTKAFIRVNASCVEDWFHTCSTAPGTIVAMGHVLDPGGQLTILQLPLTFDSTGQFWSTTTDCDLDVITWWAELADPPAGWQIESMVVEFRCCEEGEACPLTP